MIKNPITDAMLSSQMITVIQRAADSVSAEDRKSDELESL